MAESLQDIPFKIVGSTMFGRYPKISVENTYNMIISDDALVDYAGYKAVANVGEHVRGRGIHTSTIGGFMLAVIGRIVYRIGVDLVPHPVIDGVLATDSGEVFMAENNASEIAMTDGINIYVYNYTTEAFTVVTTSYGFTFKPGFITFQNTRFICAALDTNFWVLSAGNQGTVWPNDDQHIGTLETKPDTVQAAIPFPGRANQLFLFGSTIAESWNDVGAALFPYQRNSSFNVDYGCISASSIAFQGEFIVWIGISEEAGPVLMYSTGGAIEEISTDGIDYLFSTLTKPDDVSGFLVKLDGHLVYHFTFKTDNLTLLYDFSSKKFFTATDENLNYHIARKIVFFNNDYYFVSFNDGSIYKFGTQFSYYQYADDRVEEIPRIRITPPVRLPSQNWYIARELEFTVENGRENPSVTIGDVTYYNMAIDLSLSRDGGETFGSYCRYNMNPTGNRRSKIVFRRLGSANDSTYMVRFNGYERYVVFDGVLRCYTSAEAT